MPAKWEALTDEDLYALSPTERQVIYKAADGGWAGSPGQKTVARIEELTGLMIQSEQVRGEPRAFWPLSASVEAAFQVIATRLRALPAARARQAPKQPPERRPSQDPLRAQARRTATRAADHAEIRAGFRESIVAMLREEIAYGADEATRPGLRRAIEMIEELP